MKKIDVIKKMLGDYLLQKPKNQTATAFAPVNIALVKYWGKRNTELNLPMTSSLSLSLKEKGAKTVLILHDKNHDIITFNQQSIPLDSVFVKRLIEFVDFFRQQKNFFLKIDIESSVPIAAGLASSACGFASVVKALDQLFGWELSFKKLSILARLGSGSASRSLWNGFVEWHAGKQEEGMDSFAEPIDVVWPELCVGLLLVDTKQKNISSRAAMQRTVETSALYSAWPQKVSEDMATIKKAIFSQDFELFGKTAESNALTMHATMLSAWPPVNYMLPETITAIQKIWELREKGLPLYFTQDAGANLKLLFLEKDAVEIKRQFHSVEIIKI